MQKFLFSTLVEIALAKAQADIGVIPRKAAAEISTVLNEINITPEALAEGTLQNGIPTIPKAACSPGPQKHR